MRNAANYPDPFRNAAALCEVTCEQILGPCYAPQAPVRQDISEGEPGVPMRMAFRLVGSDGCTPLQDAEARMRADIDDRREALDDKAAELVAAGLVDWGRDQRNRSVLIVRGQANLLDEQSAENIDRVRQLFEELESRRDIVRLLEGVRDGEGVRIFIGSENRMFALSGSSVIAAPYRDADDKVVGVIGVIGPTRLNYARVVPMVDFTAEALTRHIA